MKLSDFIFGLNILKMYFEGQCGYHIGAEHDQFFVYATQYPVSSHDVVTLRELGWFQPDSMEEYDHASSWSAWL